MPIETAWRLSERSEPVLEAGRLLRGLVCALDRNALPARRSRPDCVASFRSGSDIRGAV